MDSEQKNEFKKLLNIVYKTVLRDKYVKKLNKKLALLDIVDNNIVSQMHTKHSSKLYGGAGGTPPAGTPPAGAPGAGAADAGAADAGAADAGAADMERQKFMGYSQELKQIIADPNNKTDFSVIQSNNDFKIKIKGQQTNAAAKITTMTNIIKNVQRFFSVAMQGKNMITGKDFQEDVQQVLHDYINELELGIGNTGKQIQELITSILGSEAPA